MIKSIDTGASSTMIRSDVSALLWLERNDRSQVFNLFLFHRRDLIQDTDYIANYFLLDLRVSRTQIENL